MATQTKQVARLTADRPGWKAAVQLWYEFERGTKRASMCQPKGAEQSTDETDDVAAICWCAVENALGKIPKPIQNCASVYLIDRIYPGDRENDYGPWLIQVQDTLNEVMALIETELDKVPWYVKPEKKNSRS
jgi:hypothetical protein